MAREVKSKENQQIKKEIDFKIFIFKQTTYYEKSVEDHFFEIKNFIKEFNIKREDIINLENKLEERISILTYYKPINKIINNDFKRREELPIKIEKIIENRSKNLAKGLMDLFETDNKEKISPPKNKQAY